MNPGVYVNFGFFGLEGRSIREVQKYERLIKQIETEYSDYLYSRELAVQGNEDAAMIDAGAELNKLMCIVRRVEVEELLESAIRERYDGESIETISDYTGLSAAFLEYVFSITVNSGGDRYEVEEIYRRGYINAVIRGMFNMRGNGMNKKNIAEITELPVEIVDELLDGLPDFFG
jgi:hypothetical protein